MATVAMLVILAFHTWRIQLAWIALQWKLPLCAETTIVNFLSWCDRRQKNAATIFLSGRQDSLNSSTWEEFTKRMDGNAWVEGISELIRHEQAGTVLLEERVLMYENFAGANFDEVPEDDVKVICDRTMKLDGALDGSGEFSRQFVGLIVFHMRHQPRFAAQLNAIAASLLSRAKNVFYLRSAIMACDKLIERNELGSECAGLLQSIAAEQLRSNGDCSAELQDLVERLNSNSPEAGGNNLGP